MLSMWENCLLVGWACVEIGYSLAKHARKLVTLWLSIRGNWLLVYWAYAEILFLLVLNHVFSLVIRSPVPFSRPLSNVLCLLSHVSVLWLPSSVPCLTSLFLISRPLFLCSVTAKLFEHRNSGENRRKRSEIFFENWPTAYKALI